MAINEERFKLADYSMRREIASKGGKASDQLTYSEERESISVPMGEDVSSERSGDTESCLGQIALSDSSKNADPK